MDHLTQAQRSVNMSKIRSKDTAPERAVRRTLTSLGWNYRLHSDKLPGKPDIVISRNNTVILVNGCFWHQHKGCKRRTVPKTNKRYWVTKLRKNVEKQKEDIKQLRKTGWKVYTVWECETKSERSLTIKLKSVL